jgi:hypothetical protein
MTERLALHARHDGERFTAVAATSGRRVTLAAGFAGQPVERVLALLPMIYSLCGGAQGIAAARAVETALGRPADPATEATRALALAGEALRELWTPVFLDWPAVLGGAPASAAARALRGLLTPRWAESPRAEVEGVVAAAAAFAPALGAPDLGAPALGAPALGAPALGAPDLGTDGLAGLWRFAETDATPAGAMLRFLRAHGLEGYGAGDVAPLPATAALGPGVAADASGAFRRAPTWNGAPAETGPLARQWDHPVVAAVRAVHGAGLLARAVARLADAADQVRRMRDSAAALWQTGRDRGTLPLPPVGAEDAGCGAGRAEAARGALVHWVDLAGGRVRDWRILAPTEWNFHPRGAWATGVVGAPAGSDPAARLRLLALLVDPCVACDVTVSADA